MSDDLRKFLANARGSATEARVLRLDDLQLQLGRPEVDAEASPWGLAAMRGRLVELSARGATATLTTAAELVLEAQRAGEPVAWVVPWSHDGRSGSAATFYPPDVADTGIDLAALVVVRAPSTIAAARAAERLLRSGAFGLVVLDFASVDFESNRAQRLPDQVLGRLVSLAQSHDAAVICLTEKTSESGSLGSLVSMRAEAMRLRSTSPSSSEGGFEVTIRALKDKRRGPGWSQRRKARGPAGLG